LPRRLAYGAARLVLRREGQAISKERAPDDTDEDMPFHRHDHEIEGAGRVISFDK
jgi:hypothetical protein